MAQRSEDPTPAAWCGRSWRGLADRRHEAFRHALALRDASPTDSAAVVNEFLTFFEETGIGLFRDEQEWVFDSLRPAPDAVIKAMEGHLEIAALAVSLFHEMQAGCIDMRVIHGLGETLKAHLLLEEEEIGPLFRGDAELVWLS